MSDNEVNFVQKAQEERLREVVKNPHFIDIKLKIKGYKEHNKLMKDVMKERLLVLDTKYNLLYKIINYIQISIIVFSSGCTFIQAADDHIPLSIEDISFISLIITSYTALILAVSKYLKFDDKKENLHKLRGQFAEFLINIQSRNDQLNTWKSDNFWAGSDTGQRIKEWTVLETKLKGEFEPIIERKQILCSEFKKEIDFESKVHYSLFVRKKSLYYGKASSKMDIKEEKLRMELLEKPIIPRMIRGLSLFRDKKPKPKDKAKSKDKDDGDDEKLVVENEPTVDDVFDDVVDDVVVDDVQHDMTVENNDVEGVTAPSPTDNVSVQVNEFNGGV